MHWNHFALKSLCQSGSVCLVQGHSLVSLLKTGVYTVKVDLAFTCFFAVSSSWSTQQWWWNCTIISGVICGCTSTSNWEFTDSQSRYNKLVKCLNLIEYNILYILRYCWQARWHITGQLKKVVRKCYCLVLEHNLWIYDSPLLFNSMNLY